MRADEEEVLLRGPTPAGPDDPGRPVDEGDPEDPDRPGPRRRMSDRRKALVGLAVLLVLLVVGGAVGLQVMTNRVLDDVERIPDVFAPIDEATRPQKPAGTEKTLNFLLVGVDTRAEEQTTGSEGDGEAFVPGRQRSDVIMIVHISADRKVASVVSLPRDSWVTIPGRGKNKINAAYSLGGGSLLVQTVELLQHARPGEVQERQGGVQLTVVVGGHVLPLRLGHGGENNAGASSGTRTSTGPEGRDVDPVGAGGAAVPPGTVLGEVDQHVVAVVGATDAEPVELLLTHDVHEGHRRLDRHPVGERRQRWSRVQVVAPVVVRDQLREGVRLAQHPVDQLDDAVLVELPESSQPGTQPAYGVQLGSVATTRPGPAPLLHEVVQRRRAGQLVAFGLLGVHQRGSSHQGDLGVMGKEHLTPSIATPTV